MQIAEELDDRSMGDACYKNGDYQMAIEYYSKALEIVEELGEKDVGRIFRSIGDTYYVIGHYQMASDCHFRSSEIAEELDHKREMGHNVTVEQTKIETSIKPTMISEVESETNLPNYVKTAVAETLKHGGKKNNRISLLFIGQDGVGKTSLKKSLLGEEPEKDQASTIGIEYEVVEVKEKDKSKPWKRAADGKFIASKQYTDGIIAKVTARRQYESQKNLEEARGGEIRSDKGEPEKGRGYVVAAGGSGYAYDVGGDGEKVEVGGQFEYKVSYEQIEEAMKNVEKYRDDTMDVIRFLVGDVAGQSVFYDVHSMMLRLRTLFTLVVDLTKSPNDVAQPKFVDKKAKKEEYLGNPLKETNLDYLTKWAVALRHLNPCDNETIKNAVESVNKLPKAIIVYTKPDKLSEGEVETKKNEVRRAVDEQLRRVGCDSLIVREFVIKNTEPRNPEESRELEDLRTTIFETAQDILEKQEKTPVNWLVLERLLADQERPYIGLDEAKQLGKQCKVEETFNDAVKFFHEENIVVHFQGNPPISSLVVLNPAWLVQLFTEVIGVSENPSWPSSKSCAWNDLQKGKLDFDKLPTVLDNHRGPRDALKEMMVRAGLICHWRANIYLVPSMVNKRMEDKRISKALSKCLKPSLFLHFEDESIPLGFYTRFQVELLKWTDGDDSKCESEELQLYCNFLRLVKWKNGSTYSVYLVRHISRIEFAILVPGTIIEWTDMARMVLSDLDEIIKRIQSTHPNFKGMRYKFGLKCDLCRDETDDPCERHQEEACCNGDCVHIWSLSELKKPLTSCPKNLVGCGTSKLHETSWVKATEPPSQLPWIPTSKIHREKFIKLREYGQKHPEKVKNINGVSVCFESEFHVGKGSGGPGVYIGLAKDGYERAVKCVSKVENENVGSHEKEILNTPNAVNSKRVVNYRYYDEELNDHIAYLVLDLHEETLRDYIRRESQAILTARAPVITQQMLEGLDDLHREPKPILHRDLKPSNILRDVQGEWLLADFGISRTLPEGQTTHESEERGTKYWRAVESYDGGKYKKQSDIQAAGMVCFYILTKGDHPFGPEDDRVRNLRKGEADLTCLTDLVAKDLISWMLQHKPKDRPYAHQALKHPYLQLSIQQFELLKGVGNQSEIKTGDSSCDVVRELSIDPLLSKITWKSQIAPHIRDYLFSDGKRPLPYGDEWTECLRLIRNTFQHWNERPCPRPEVHYEIGEPREYFLNVFPTLPVVLHRIIRSKEDWRKRSELQELF